MKASTILYTLAFSATSVLAHGDESTPTGVSNSSTPVHSGIAHGTANSTLPVASSTATPFEGAAGGRAVEMGVLVGGVLVGLGLWI